MQQLNSQDEIYSIEDNNVLDRIKDADEIILAYPIYYSNLPLILRDFIMKNQQIWYHKKVFIIATMGLFSGDGCAARLLKKSNATITGGLHITMPDTIIDVKLLKKNAEEEKLLYAKAQAKIKKASEQYLLNSPTKQGLSLPSHGLGLFGQRLWFSKMTSSYKNMPKIQKETCIKCNLCVPTCPMDNLSIEEDGQVIGSNQCTLCYRCVHVCPVNAITILGKEVVHKPHFK